MNEETKQELDVALQLLKNVCIKNGVSAGFDKKDGALVFFDTEEYFKTGKLKGICVKLLDLVE